MKVISVLLAIFMFSQTAFSQKTVAAVVSFTGTDTSVTLRKGDNFVVELWIPNRKNYSWSVSRPASNCKFLQSQIGEAATMPGAPEKWLWFFKASQKGTDSLHFQYKSPYEGQPAEYRKLVVKVE